LNPNLNRYTCKNCGRSVVTIDREMGVTPMFLNCRATAGCSGDMSSAMYRSVVVEPTFEWRKPTPDEYKEMPRAMKDHIDMGGLAIYPIEKPRQA